MLRKYFLLFLFTLLIALPLNLFSQIGRVYTTVDNLSSSYITQIFQDSYGYIWISTEYGLNRFDGINFKTYKHDSSNPNSIKNNYVRTIFEDDNKNLIIGCYNGLIKYDRASDSFVDIPMLRDGKEQVPYVADICKLKSGEVWIVTAGQGVFALDKNYTSANYINSFMEKVGYHFYNTIFQDKDDNIWLGTEYNGIVKHNLKNDELRFYKQPEIYSNSVYAINQSKDGDLLIGHRRGGVMKYNSSLDKFELVNCASTNANINVHCIENVGGDLLVGSDGDGIKIYNPKTNLLDDYAPLYLYNNYMKSKAHSILKDRDNNLWVGFYQKGLVFVPQNRKTFQYYGYRSMRHNIIGDNCVMSILKGDDGKLFIGTDKDGLYILDEKGEVIKHLSPNNWGNYFPSSILSMCIDSKGELWVGTALKGLAKVDIQSGKVTTFKELDGIQVNAIVQVKEKLYLGTQGSGLYSLNLENNLILKCERYNNWVNDELPNKWINSLFRDKDGKLWIGHSKGVTCFDPNKNSFLAYGNKNIIIHDCICYSIMEDYNGDIWAGTSEGLYRIFKKSGKATHYTIDNGLPHNVITGICEDDKKNLWLSTLMGLSKFNVEANNFINYYERDGLQGNEFIYGSYYKDKSGMIYFGGANGLTLFSPNKIHDSFEKYNIVITDFIIGQGSVNSKTLSGGNNVINSCVSDADKFVLGSSDNTFTVCFSTFQYDNPQQIVYNYRVKELSQNWNALQSGKNSVTYNSLSPGTYTFQVRAIVNGTESAVRTISVVITPPWYKSVLAYIIYLILLIVQIFYIYKYIRMKIRHKHEIIIRKSEEKLNEDKMQFFINISHEIRTPMTLIMSPLEKLISQATDKSLKDSYITIYRNAQRILRLVNQLLDVRKLDKGQMVLKFRKVNIVRIIDDVVLSFVPLSKKKNIEFSFIHQSNELYAWIDTNNFDKILMNIIFNAFKYTPEGGKVEIYLETGNDYSSQGALNEYFEIRISDSGIGIEEEKIERIFERFYQIENEISQSNYGTGIGLHLTRSLVELHHGKIFAKNQIDGKGAIFTVRIPLGNSHLLKEQIEIDEESDKEIGRYNKSNDYYLENIDNEVDESDLHKKVRRKSDFKVVIVEDDDEISSYLERELSDEYKIILAKNGKEGYEKILETVPDLVISDVMMPYIDGLTLSKKIKQNVIINHIPIVLLTAKASIDDKIEGIDIGVDAYFEKPFNIELLRRSISNLILNRRLLRTKYTGAQEQSDKLDTIEIKTSDQALMERIMKVINENIDNADLNVEMLARSVGLSRVHIHRKMKELTNMSTRDFIKNIRLNQAEKLLQKNGANVSDVAFATGFVTLSHFSTSFKDKYGVTPTDYNKLYLRKELKDINEKEEEA